MKPVMVTVILLSITGCTLMVKPVETGPAATDPNMLDAVLKPNETWAAQFGDDNTVTLFYNIAVFRNVLANLQNRLNELEKKTQYMPGVEPAPVKDD